LFLRRSSSEDSEDPVVIEATDNATPAKNQAAADASASAADESTTATAAATANWFESLDSETRKQLAEKKKLEGNELFGTACFQQAAKKYSEVQLVRYLPTSVSDPGFIFYGSGSWIFSPIRIPDPDSGNRKRIFQRKNKTLGEKLCY